MGCVSQIQRHLSRSNLLHIEHQTFMFGRPGFLKYLFRVSYIEGGRGGGGGGVKESGCLLQNLTSKRGT